MSFLQVYVEPHQLGWRPLAISWIATLPAHIDQVCECRRTHAFASTHAHAHTHTQTTHGRFSAQVCLIHTFVYQILRKQLLQSHDLTFPKTRCVFSTSKLALIEARARDY